MYQGLSTDQWWTKQLTSSHNKLNWKRVTEITANLALYPTAGCCHIANWTHDLRNTAHQFWQFRDNSCDCLHVTTLTKLHSYKHHYDVGLCRKQQIGSDLVFKNQMSKNLTSVQTVFRRKQCAIRNKIKSDKKSLYLHSMWTDTHTKHELLSTRGSSLYRWFIDVQLYTSVHQLQINEMTLDAFVTVY